jgi:hypothetical protein
MALCSYSASIASRFSTVFGGGGDDVFLVGEAWFAVMGMHVDGARDDVLASRVDDARRIRRRSRRDDSRDAFALDHEVCQPRAMWRHDGPAKDRDVGAHERPR